MNRRILIVCVAIGCLGIGFAGGYLIRGPQKPIAGGTPTASPRAVTRVPDIIGLDFGAALQELHAAGLGADVTAFRTRVKPRGVVLTQSPTHPARVRKGTYIVVEISAGYSLRPIGVAHCALRPPEPPGSPPCFGGFGQIPVTVSPGF
jgi:PASTA domain-containing protein